ncbi:hypothetical protein B0T24DRAFT_717113 [Lasiosphaeria ovina]|uniref:Uncharacterized protein n=1 Tax=Lasiosphaeria ovina TaxID=92902 RepID=A0AAE0NDN7_9PEZI|nr:hypothetical protein B0T24DRAFT_717113 [Lasiosphaeria ovina]
MSSWQLSNLSGPRYGYDFVIATTQSSINATMKYFLSGLTEPLVRYCFVADDDGNPVPIDFNELLKRTGNLDPFTLPGNLAGSDARVKKLIAARFLAGFRAQIGLPGGNDPGDIIVLGGDTSQVTFNMPCSEFTIMSLQGGLFGPIKTFKASQDPEKPWTFSSKVDLRLDPVDKGAYTNLPKDVKAAIMNLGADTFSVQQLLFDLTNSQLAANPPTISGVVLGSIEATLLDQYFRNGYFQTLRKNGEPILGATITSNLRQASTLHMTSFNFHTQTYQPVSATSYDLDVLNYLCAVDGKTLPPVANFDWNWVTPAELTDHDGVISVNRNAFSGWFRSQLSSVARANCWAFDVSAKYDVGKASVILTVSPSGYQTPKDNPSATGAQVINYTYSHSSFDQAGLNGALAKIGVDSSYSMTVAFADTAVTVTQNILVTLKLEALSSSSGPSNVVDKTIVDTYSVGVANDTLVFKKTATSSDRSNRQHIDGFRDLFLNYNAIVDSFGEALSRITSTNFVDIPVTQLQNFVFPGGRTFAFKKAAFSKNQDLVSLITYTDPRK